MAGGVGERFWPCSRHALPKQFLSIVSESTLIESTVERLSELAPVENICIATTAEQAGLFREKLPRIPKENIILEPALRNTAPCIGLSAFLLSRRYEGEEIVIGIFPADHVIKDLDIFKDTINAAMEIVSSRDRICQIGIKPTFPSTGYGYIHRGEHLDTVRGVEIYDVLGFREKPAPDIAQDYLDTGQYYWNGGMFIFRPEVMIGEFERYMPNTFKGLKEIADSDSKKLNEIYPTLEKISIDYGIIEKTKKRCVAEARFYWDDVGAWDAVEKYFEKDKNRNVVKGEFFGEDCDECLIFNHGNLTVTGIGLDEMIVVTCDDAVLICPKNRAQEVKKIVRKLREEGRENLL
jgi:mannose-1-phosphate guanylyltransferase